MSRLELALQEIESGNYQDGEKLLSDIVNEDENFEALGHLAWLRLQTGKYPEALVDYSKLTEQNPEDSDLKLLYAKAVLKNGDPEKAIGLASELLREDIGNYRATKIIFDAQTLLGFENPEEEPCIDRFSVNSVLDRLEDDPGSAFPTSSHPDVSRFIYSLVRAVKPKVALETGTFIGYSTISIAQALEDQKEGHLHCFDIFKSGFQDYSSPLVGKPDDFQMIAKGHVEQSGLGHRVTLHKGDSSSKIREVFPEEKPILDFAFIDGDHTTEGCLKDWLAVEARLTEGALVVLHDTNPEGCAWLGPRFLMEKLDEHHRNQYRWVNIPTLEGVGLGILQKRNLKDRTTWRPSFWENLLDYYYTQLKWRFEKRFKK